MTQDSSDAPAVSRRTVLRSGVAAAGGLVLATGAATAHECPRSPGYWANHPWPDTISDPFEIGGVTMTVAEWQAFLIAPTEDKATIVAKHLVVTVLNFQFRGALPEGDPGCVDEPLSGFGGATIREIRLAAERWLDASSFDDPRASQETWLAGGVDGEPLKNALDAFNNDRLGLDCDCDGGDDSPGAAGGGGPPAEAGGGDQPETAGGDDSPGAADDDSPEAAGGGPPAGRGPR